MANELDLDVHTIEFQSDAMVLFYTDGVTECSRNIDAAENILLQTLSQLFTEKSRERPAVALQRAVMGFGRLPDDAVIMVLQLAPHPIAARPERRDLRKTWMFHSSDAYSAHASRHELMKFVRRFVTDDDKLYRIELLIGEVLANTVKHTPGLVTVEIDWSRGIPVMTIHDKGPGMSDFPPSLPSDDFMENGRGLYLVGVLAHAVRVESTNGSGTRLTIELPVSP